jgi:hypothetical protein
MLAIYLLDHWYLTLGILGLLLLATEVGFRFGWWRQARVDADGRAQIVTMQAAILGLLALLLGFTFALAASRFEARKGLVLQESNAIGTAYLRFALLLAPAREELEALMRRYVEARLALNQAESWDSLRAAQTAASQLQNAMWTRMGELVREDGRPVPHGLILQVLNDVIDLDAERRAALFNRVPGVILALLLGVGALALLITGYSFGPGGGRSLLATLVMPLLIAGVIAVIIDLDRPYRGLSQIGQQSLLELQESLTRSGP